MKQFDEAGIFYKPNKLYVGDYQNVSNSMLSIDRKQNLSEIYSNVCHDHERFRNELIRANEAGIKLIILCEHGGSIQTLEDVKNWYNPQLKKSPYAWNGERLYKTLRTIQDKYKVDFEFCTKSKYR